MPIVVHAMSDSEFQAWLIDAKTKFADATPAATDAAPIKLATIQR